MKKVLFINSCVRENSRTLKLCRHFLEELKKIPDLFIEQENLNESPLLPLNRERLQSRDALIEKNDFANPRFECARKFSQSDIILFGAPYWDMSIPALLKIYIENIMVENLTFTFGEKGEYEHIVRAKHMVYISTAGGDVSSYDGGWKYLDDVADMFVIPYRYRCLAQGLDIAGCDVEEALGKAKQELDQIAREIEVKEI